MTTNNSVNDGTRTAHSIAIMQGTNTPNYLTLTNGQILIGSTGLDPVAAAITASTNMTVSNSAGGISLASKGGLIGTQIFTSGTAATYTPTAGTNNIVIELIGGGGGGGGAAAVTGAGAAAGGGGGGAYLRKLITGMSGLTGTYTVGATANGGAAGNNNGTDGNNTTFLMNAITYTASGGLKGTGSASQSLAGGFGVGGSGGNTTNADFTVLGANGSSGYIIVAAAIATGGNGGNTFYSTVSSVRYAISSQIAGNGNLWGCGGNGALSTGTQSAMAGGNGASGLIIVWEYS